MPHPLNPLNREGQSVWLDFITRGILSDGTLERLIQEAGVTGVTSNPAIFQNAMTKTRDYDGAVAALARAGKSSESIFEILAVEDIQAACDLFRPVYDAAEGADGYVSLEVNPHLARDTKGTLDEARRLCRAVKRRNLMIKIPGTRESLPAIEQALGEGIHVNVTLIFSLSRYEEVLRAWLAGLERLARAGKPLAGAASVASFFVSRVDAWVDGWLEKNKPAGWESLLGRAAIANAQRAYEIFQAMTNSAAWADLAARGARVQRPLWASTSAKNPRYRDVVYVEELIGADTVNTMPLATLEAFRDHGVARKALPADPAASREVFRRLEEAGLSMDSVTRDLEAQGIRLFQDAYDGLISRLDEKRAVVKS